MNILINLGIVYPMQFIFLVSHFIYRGDVTDSIMKGLIRRIIKSSFKDKNFQFFLFEGM